MVEGKRRRGWLLVSVLAAALAAGAGCGRSHTAARSSDARPDLGDEPIVLTPSFSMGFSFEAEDDLGRFSLFMGHSRAEGVELCDLGPGTTTPVVFGRDGWSAKLSIGRRLDVMATDIPLPPDEAPQVDATVALEGRAELSVEKLPAEVGAVGDGDVEGGFAVLRVESLAIEGSVARMLGVVGDTRAVEIKPSVLINSFWGATAILHPPGPERLLCDG